MKIAAGAALPAALIASFATLPAAAQTCKPGDPKMDGLYTLGGVMETGSQILLNANGSFRYMLAYGAVDEAAEGCWQRNGASVTLIPTKMQVSRGGTKFERLELPVDASGGLVRQFGARRGVYSRR